MREKFDKRESVTVLKYEVKSIVPSRTLIIMGTLKLGNAARIWPINSSMSSHDSDRRCLFNTPNNPSISSCVLPGINGRIDAVQLT